MRAWKGKQSLYRGLSLTLALLTTFLRKLPLRAQVPRALVLGGVPISHAEGHELGGAVVDGTPWRGGPPHTELCEAPTQLTPSPSLSCVGRRCSVFSLLTTVSLRAPCPCSRSGVGPSFASQCSQALLLSFQMYPENILLAHFPGSSDF